MAPPPKGAATEPTPGSDSAATEHTEEPQLVELVNQGAGQSSVIELKVIRSEIIDYDYTWNGNPVTTQKLQVILQSKIPDQYCVGVVKLQKKDKNELKKIADRWQTGTTWRFKAIILLGASRLILTPHAASQSICASRRLRRCYRARSFHRHQCQQLLSQTYCNWSKCSVSISWPLQPKS